MFNLKKNGFNDCVDVSNCLKHVELSDTATRAQRVLSYRLIQAPGGRLNIYGNIKRRRSKYIPYSITEFFASLLP